MATLLAKIIADFTTSLATELAIGGTSATLQSATDDDAVALPAGRYFFTIDGGNGQKEHISCSLSGTALTSIKTVSRQGVETAGVLRKHRIGATISITDFAHIFQINNLLNGTTALNGSTPLIYDTDPTISDNKHLATKKYMDDLALAGAPVATTTVLGISKLSVVAADVANPIVVGDNDGRMPTTDEKAAMAGTGTPSGANKFVTADDAALTNNVKLTGDQTVAGIKTMTSIPVLPASDPTTANQAVRKAYVDGLVAITSGSATVGGSGTLTWNKQGKLYFNFVYSNSTGGMFGPDATTVAKICATFLGITSSVVYSASIYGVSTYTWSGAVWNNDPPGNSYRSVCQAILST